jgi:hypothetical protein
MFRRTVVVSFLLFVCVAGLVGCAGPRTDAKADEVLVAMVNKLAGSDQLTIRGFRDVDAGFAPGLAMPESAEAEAMVGAADRFAAHILGEGVDRWTYYNGETLTVYDAVANVYASVPAPETIDELMEVLDEEYGFSPPMADFVMNDPYRCLTKGATTVTYAGREWVSRFECDRVTIVRKDATTDLWVSVDDGLPVRLVVTRATEGEPRLAVDVAAIELNVEHGDEVFEFVPPEGAQEADSLPLGQ